MKHIVIGNSLVGASVNFDPQRILKRKAAWMDDLMEESFSKFRSAEDIETLNELNIACPKGSFSKFRSAEDIETG